MCTMHIHPKRTRQGKPKLVLLHQGCRQLCTILHPACNPRRWEDKGWFWMQLCTILHLSVTCAPNVQPKKMRRTRKVKFGSSRFSRHNHIFAHTQSLQFHSFQEQLSHLSISKKYFWGNIIPSQVSNITTFSKKNHERVVLQHATLHRGSSGGRFGFFLKSFSFLPRQPSPLCPSGHWMEPPVAVLSGKGFLPASVQNIQRRRYD